MFVRWKLDVFFPDFSFSLTQRLQAILCMHSLFHSVFLLLWSANVCKECVLWLKHEITEFSRCLGWPYVSSVMGKILDKMLNLWEVTVFHEVVQVISFLWRPLRFPNRELGKDQMLNYWTCSYFRLQSEKNCISF